MGEIMFEDNTLYIKNKEKVKKNCIVVVGLPGIGLVGKLVVDYLIKQLKAKKFAVFYSPAFPPQVIMKKNGKLRMLSYRFYHANVSNKEFIFLVGDIQPFDSSWQYSVCSDTLNFLLKFKPKEIITIGGYGTNQFIQNPRVLGAANTKSEIERYKKLGVVFGEAKGSIVGAAGLYITMAYHAGVEGICLMGETHGAYVDANAAKAVLEVIAKRFNIKIDYSELKKKVELTERAMKEIEEELKKMGEERGKENLGYYR
ncbi:MAG: proteasome assembly chaperone family protein [Candidatus Micrarchaeia archaeon]